MPQGLPRHSVLLIIFGKRKTRLDSVIDANLKDSQCHGPKVSARGFYAASS
jgi:hypothetical protein